MPGRHVMDANAPLQAQVGRMPAAARAVQRLLTHLRHGALEVHWPNGAVVHAGQTAEQAGRAVVRAVVHVHDWRTCARVLRSGDIGFAESYIEGQWTTPDLTALLSVLIANRDAIEDMFHGHWLGRLTYLVKHWLRRNTRTNSRKNIHAHYDLGNDFYKLWLDATMNYSSAWFDGKLDQPLSDAQNAKVQRALTQAGVLSSPGQRVLEIGCGWGALAEMAATQAHAKVVGVTLSTEQWQWGQQRCEHLRDAQGQALVDLRLQDYRDIRDEPFDAVVSIEMFEAVGQAYWPQYFQTVARLLKRGGKACVQTITIRDDLFDRYSRSTDFIQQYIFPGGMLPSDAQFRQHAQAAGLKVTQAMDFGPDYAETLRRWRAAFKQHDAQVRAQGFDERFMRIWEFYLCYCEAAFDGKNTSVVQYTLAHQD